MSGKTPNSSSIPPVESSVDASDSFNIPIVQQESLSSELTSIDVLYLCIVHLAGHARTLFERYTAAESLRQQILLKNLLTNLNSVIEELEKVRLRLCQIAHEGSRAEAGGEVADMVPGTHGWTSDAEGGTGTQ
uniref:Uncharacterized protein n=1 Tax=Steinernema glaseri TaxID=37863 RepID=A0A1I7YB16_9BILA